MFRPYTSHMASSRRPHKSFRWARIRDQSRDRVNSEQHRRQSLVPRHSPRMDDLEPFESLGLSISALPEINLGFRIPRLIEKPQNPIVESLQLWHRTANKPLPQTGDKPLPNSPAGEGIVLPALSLELQEQDLWRGLLSHKPALTVCTLALALVTWC